MCQQYTMSSAAVFEVGLVNSARQMFSVAAIAGFKSNDALLLSAGMHCIDTTRIALSTRANVLTAR
jgi:hypothetical protein